MDVTNVDTIITQHLSTTSSLSNIVRALAKATYRGAAPPWFLHALLKNVCHASKVAEQCEGILRWCVQNIDIAITTLGGVRNYRKLKSFHNTLRSGWVSHGRLRSQKNTEITNRLCIVVITKNNVTLLVIV